MGTHRIAGSLNPVPALEEHKLHRPEGLHIETFLGLAQDLFACASLVASVNDTAAGGVLPL